MTEPTPDGEASRLEEAYRAAKEEEQRLRRGVRLMTLALFLTVVACLTAILVRAAQQYSPRQFESHAQSELSRLAPPLGRSLLGVAEKVGPEYLKLGREEFRKALPALQAVASEECRRLGSSLRNRAEAQIQEALGRVEARQWERLKAEFPALSNPGARERYRERWKEELTENGREIVLDFQKRFGGDAQKLGQAIRSFLPNRYDSLSEERLHREFLHLCLMLADAQVVGDAEKRGKSHGR